jgi:hypothetical protein
VQAQADIEQAVVDLLPGDLRGACTSPSRPPASPDG